MTAPATPSAERPHLLCPQSIERALRFGAGTVLMVFVAMHLLNHALGVFGVAALDWGQTLRFAIWRNPIGTSLLYGSLAVHVGLTLKRVLARRTLRMPPVEALQLVLGLAIPIFLAPHILGTRFMAERGVSDYYIHVLRNLWPGLALWQTALVAMVWVHGVIGIRAAFRDKPRFARWRGPLVVLAALLPMLALAGFVAGGREAQATPTERVAPTAADVEAFNSAAMIAKTGTWLVIAGVLGVFGWRAGRRFLKPHVSVRYVGHGAVRSPVGMTLLEISRSNRIPHASLCGGKGRCSTCRVLLTSGHETLPPPMGIELRLLDRIRAPQRVRLACQVRPTRPLGVRILLPGDVGRDEGASDAALDWGREQEVAILFADIRAFSALARHQLPADAVSLLNRVLTDMIQAVEAHGGEVALVPTDGIMAIFRADRTLRRATLAALTSASDILHAVDATNREMGSALPQPLRAGVGVHAGPVILARIGDGERARRLTAIGEAVFAADALEAASKEHAVDAMISQDALKAAGIAPPSGPARSIAYKSGETALMAYAAEDARALDDLLGRRARPNPEAARPPRGGKPHVTHADAIEASLDGGSG
ncbi:adenylate/guanylate cyclase domain-containing protein [Salinarimonas soli]|uniref:2Fe-2S iron-sulfur cluster binding domain-containing protein n=1 Tax=Salinarimonas soli TaxID=1638099 RepID=A0A5B2VAC4_9HYPH|nr:adenylate/guanylate cyclase domain-containing protein [Salinarimonas soli]KAA2235545.1 2Fe-2S iron-sulfur cluster binding domain-containing protein [Salinarimonas soli]